MHIKKISAVIIDTYQNKKLPILAIEKTLEFNKVGKVYTFSDVPYFEGAKFVQIPKITSIKDYEKLVLDSIKNTVQEDFLLIQWDGFVLRPSNWRDEFLNYDYIGAPVLYNGKTVVGNGGFSFRSLKLINALAEIRGDVKNQFSDLPEDMLISVGHRVCLEKLGVIFSPLEIASKFSFESSEYPTDYRNLFGFHGPWNFAIFFNEKFILPYANEIIQRTTSFMSLVVFLEQCQKMEKNTLLLESISSIKNHPNITQMISKHLSDETYSRWATRFFRVMGSYSYE